MILVAATARTALATRFNHLADVAKAISSVTSCPLGGFVGKTNVFYLGEGMVAIKP